MHERHRQVLVIGLDAMEWTLVKRWAEEGVLPTFRRLLAEGASGELATTASQLPDTVWASICTGMNPAKFSKYFYIQYNPKTGALEHLPDDVIHATPFWEHLSDAGRRVSIVDVPKFPLSKRINGLHLANWGAHATKTPRAASPESLQTEVIRKFGAHPVGDCDVVDQRPASLRALRRRTLDGVRAHGALFRWLMQERPWDLFFAGFSAPHCIGHHFWHFMDPTHPRFDPSDRHGLRDTIEVIYRALDEEIARMLELAGEDAHGVIFAGHGMGALYHASWNLPEILDRLGYGRVVRGAATTRETTRARVNPWRLLKLMVPGFMQYAIKGILPRRVQDELLFRWYAGSRDWIACRAFAVPNNDAVGTIRINVKGRDKYGIVQPGQEFEKLCEDIAAALYELVDPRTGRRVISRVDHLRRVFHGPYLHQLPDLTILWDQSFPWDTIHSDRLDTLQLRQQDARTGSHTPHGFLLMRGPEISRGRILHGHSIYDIAPTLLQLSGVPIPDQLDGKPIPLR